MEMRWRKSGSLFSSQKYRDCIVLVCVALVLIWLQGWCNIPRRILGVQPELFPVLVLYCALYRTWAELFIVTGVGSVFYDSLSLNPLGCTLLSTLLVSYVIHSNRSVVLFDRVRVQMMLGAGISVVIPFLTLFQLMNLSVPPFMNWAVLWTFVVLAGAGAIFAPILFWVLDKFFQRLPEKNFNL